MPYLFTVEENVPIPKKRKEAKGGNYPGNRYIYPFPEMKVGDSFFVPDGRQSHLCRTANNWGYNHQGRKFTTRIMDNGVRIWRIK